MRNSLSININICSAMLKYNVQDVLFTSSACVYPEYLQDTDNIPTLEEHTVYPASPDSEYGWEKLISERLYINHAKNHNFRVRIARLHNVFGPLGTYQGGKEKAPAALCRKVATSNRVEIWGDGQQQRSFLYIDQCIEGIIRLHQSDCNLPLNIGSEKTVTINELVNIIANHSNRRVNKIHVDGPQGVRSRTSNNSLVNEKLNWVPDENLEQGLYETYNWIQEQIANDE